MPGSLPYGNSRQTGVDQTGANPVGVLGSRQGRCVSRDCLSVQAYRNLLRKSVPKCALDLAPGRALPFGVASVDTSDRLLFWPHWRGLGDRPNGLLHEAAAVALEQTVSLGCNQGPTTYCVLSRDRHSGTRRSICITSRLGSRGSSTPHVP
ncbi:hypothetical protein VTK73DRAFT_3886 [Phialemonium thermophilum]|uniref:Uncharacterized protein n=1 Tax=Phialemonium thermophilum TaxID=223376 RepID=A0ABR3VDX3_9PEZI